MIGVEILEHWQQVKVYRMSLKKYPEKGKIKVLKCTVELLTHI